MSASDEVLPNTSRAPDSPELEPGFRGVRIAGPKSARLGARLVVRGAFRVDGPKRDGLHCALALVVTLPGGWHCSMPFRWLVAMQDDVQPDDGAFAGWFNLDVFDPLGDDLGAGAYSVSSSLSTDLSNVLEVAVEE